jgi:hypothetical protein
VFNLESLAHHPGIIYLPYTYGTANFYEMYTMAIPMFCPSLALLERSLRTALQQITAVQRSAHAVQHGALQCNSMRRKAVQRGAKLPTREPPSSTSHPHRVQRRASL